ncbi:MAG: hypothetical protein KIT72_11215 [Polyangiaceae bacterium]|nr:hypothetical protein [Polyangiaceae bacterium]
MQLPEKPLLASDALREDLAPVEPAGREVRLWTLLVATLLVALGIAFRFGVGHPVLRVEASTLSFCAAAATLGAAALPFGYLARGLLMLALGVGLMALGFQGLGPLHGMAIDGGFLRDLTRLLALTTLPSALLFRAFYRAYAPARWLLAVALVLALPFVVSEGLLAIDASAVVWSRVAAVVNALVILCSLFGFTSSATSGGGSWWAALVLLLIPCGIATRELTPLAGADDGYFTYVATAVGVQCASVLAALGLFQVGAARLAPHARDTSLPSRPSPRPPSPAS